MATKFDIEKRRPDQRCCRVASHSAEGTVADQVAVVNRDRLVAVWSELLLPRRVRELWESRFPELCAAVSA